MTITYSQLFAPQQLGVAASTLFTVPSTPTTTLLRGGRVRLANTSAGAVTATLYAVPPAGSPVDANAFLKGKSIAANDYLDIDVPMSGQGYTIQGLAGAATSITVSPLAGGYFS